MPHPVAAGQGFDRRPFGLIRMAVAQPDRPGRVVVFGWGNVTRGDDGLGPLLMARLERAAFPHVTVVEDFQLQIEHALDIDGHDLVLFVDAGEGTPAPYSFAETQANANVSHTSHALPPEAVLSVYRKVKGAAPPPAFVLCVRGEVFALAEGLSPEAREHMERAWDFLQARLAAPQAEAWRAALSD